MQIPQVINHQIWVDEGLLHVLLDSPLATSLMVFFCLLYSPVLLNNLPVLNL